jgi:hypothetical protein
LRLRRMFLLPPLDDSETGPRIPSEGGNVSVARLRLQHLCADAALRQVGESSVTELVERVAAF